MRTMVLIALSLIGCQKEPPPPTAPPQTEPPKDETNPNVDVLGEPQTFSPPTPAAVCTYELKEVMTQALGDQPMAHHTITITYELRALENLTFEGEVTRVQADARQETYNAKLDSLRAGDLMRVQGGADTIGMYEMVLPFAFLENRVTFQLDARGRLIAVKGGDAVRKSLMEMHPPKPRKEAHYLKKAEVALSDEAIAEYLFPSALVIPKEGPLQSGRQEVGEATVDLIEYVGQGSEGFRISLRPDRWLIQQKRAFVPVPGGVSQVPPLAKPVSTVELMKGDRDLTVELEPKNPCFKRAGSTFNDLAVWTGFIKDAQTTTERKRVITRIWTKQ